MLTVTLRDSKTHTFPLNCIARQEGGYLSIRDTESNNLAVYAPDVWAFFKFEKEEA